ncbi:ABC transporter permease [Mucilaginibacter sp. CSA2-8R]|uniref:ABC transporter permease n=1 Tax=Mucilaginibacter sp. CSA2-8R TaxID=3141542 RepID=UPI00315C8C87
MIKNYLKIAWRNMVSNKLFSTLNIAGLAIGMCVCITLFACITYEMSFDRMFINYKDIYRVNMQTSADYNYKVWSELPNAVGPALSQNIPQVQLATRLIKHDFGAKVSIKTDEKNFTERGLYMADSTVFRMFDVKFIEGSSRTAFSQPKSIVLSQAAKVRLYGNGSALGKLIYVNNRDTLHVSGVYADMPANSTVDCDMIYNIMDTWAGKDVYWSNSSYETYCMLKPGADLNSVQQQATALIDKNISKDNKFFTKFLFQPLAEVHLYSADIREGYTSRPGSISTVKALIFLSVLILFIACINYMNLVTARSQKRAKGVGVSKVLGADSRQMLLLFYSETALFSLIAIIIGYTLALLAEPVFQSITGIALTRSALLSWPILVGLVSIWFIVTLLAGSYPALSMSGISPLVLMNKLKLKNSTGDFVRRTLVVFQFASSVILIIAVIIILQQISFIRNKDLGYNPNGIVSINIASSQNKNQVAALINDLHGLAGVESVSAVQSVPGDVESGRSVRKLITDKEGMPVKTCHTDGSIVKTMQLKLLAGQPLPATVASGDTICYALINEAVLNYLGFYSPQDAIGKYITSEMAHKTVVVGVVKNFNYQSLKNEVGGYVYYTMNKAPESLRTLLVRYNTQDVTQLMHNVEGKFKTDLPNSSFDFEFLDNRIQNLYASEQHMASTATTFSMLAIFVACLGLFGLAAFIAEQRTKEIGIRKVLGASVSGVTKLLTADFMKLVVLSILIASPIGWYLMDKWLMAFNYRISISPWAFVIAGATAILFALLTVSSHAIKAAVANPVKSLRSE